MINFVKNNPKTVAGIVLGLLILAIVAGGGYGE